ncbi:MAG: transcription elongation factor GreA [Pseudomonadota bacterium]|nr:transcription elongation factor GreA [Pseudomonadota bacterium]MEC7830751.1 transcription elongation factor GreA [Pseudomonadota bacterium]MEC9382643.1 transcription elongation factor GreA [Pseudomonadota bacterium]MEC9414435.1 transcription elongation factor GreA [Pseudomonadota bacterium]
MMDKIPITNNGKLKVEEELKSLKTIERPKIINAIAEARAHGDLSENAEYHAAKEEQGHNETRIMELEDLLSKAEVIDPSSLDGNDIKFGAKVYLVDVDTDEEANYQIVGDIESDFKEKKISISSPLAKALIGKTVGDEVEVNTPGGGKSYEIIKVLYN